MSKHQFTDIRVAIEPDNPAVQRLEFKCIKCGSCKAVCTDYIGVCGTYDLKATGDVPICINCGQCANVCPADSITEKVEAYEVAAAMRDPEKIVIFSTSPSVRIALGEEFAMADGSFVEGKMVALLKNWGQIMCWILILLLTLRSWKKPVSWWNVSQKAKNRCHSLPVAVRPGSNLLKPIIRKCFRIFPVLKAR